MIFNVRNFLSQYFIGYKQDEFWNDSIVIHHIHEYLPFFQTIIIKFSVIFGILFSSLLFFYRKTLADSISRIFQPIYNLFFNKWYFDELYNYIFTKNFFILGNIFWKNGDTKLIDRLGPNGVSKVVNYASKTLSLLQSGYLYHYAFIMLFGLVLILTWFVLF